MTFKLVVPTVESEALVKFLPCHAIVDSAPEAGCIAVAYPNFVLIGRMYCNLVSNGVCHLIGYWILVECCSRIKRIEDSAPCGDYNLVGVGTREGHCIYRFVKGVNR